jgi:hypothetical protein
VITEQEQADDGGEDLPPPVVTPAAGKKRNGNAARPAEAAPAPVAQSLVHEDAKEVFSWLRGLGQAGMIRAKLSRLSPATTQDGQPCRGFLQEYEEIVDEKEIMRIWGGGTFQMKVQTQNPRGGWIYAGQRQFDIGVPPKVPGGHVEKDRDDGPVVVPQSDGVTRQALSMMSDLTKDAQRRADRAEERRPESGMNLDALNLALQPLRDQISALNAQLIGRDNQLAAKDKTIAELMMKKPDTSFYETMLIKSTDAENGALSRMRDNHESELRQLRQSHADDLKFTRESHARELDSRERAHLRELQSLRDMTVMAGTATATGTEARIDAFKREISSLERQLATQTAELATLREKKDKSFVETLGEIASTKAALDGLTGGEAPEEAPIWERAMSTILDSPLAKAVAHRVEQAPAQPPPQPQQVVRRVVRRRVDPNAPVQVPPQQAGPTDTSVMEQGLAEQPVEGAPAAAPVQAPKKKPEPPKFNQVEMSMAIQFMENAVTSSQSPEVFAESIRSSVPGSIINYIRDAGIDEFLRIARVPDSSSLNSQHGKNFIRKVAKILVGGAE